MAIMLITHDLGVVAEVADEVAVMYLGRSWSRRTCDDIFRAPQASLYAGAAAIRSRGSTRRRGQPPGADRGHGAEPLRPARRAARSTPAARDRVAGPLRRRCRSSDAGPGRGRAASNTTRGHAGLRAHASRGPADGPRLTPTPLAVPAHASAALPRCRGPQASTFPSAAGRFSRKRRTVKAVDGVRLRVDGRRDAGPRRRVRLRQVDPRARRSCASTSRPPARSTIAAAAARRRSISPRPDEDALRAPIASTCA